MNTPTTFYLFRPSSWMMGAVLYIIACTAGLFLPEPFSALSVLGLATVLMLTAACVGYILDSLAFPIFKPGHFVSQKRYWWAGLAALRRFAIMLACLVWVYTLVEVAT